MFEGRIFFFFFFLGGGQSITKKKEKENRAFPKFCTEGDLGGAHALMEEVEGHMPSHMPLLALPTTS